MRVPLSLACGAYDRTAALARGDIRPEGVDLTFLALPVEETFFRMTRHREFDAAEMSLSSYLISLDQGAPFVAIPAFVSRAFRHNGIYVGAASGVSDPAGLAGGMVGVAEYQLTANVWIRGILAERHGTRDVMGADFWTYGLAGNEDTLRTFVRYSFEQGLVSREREPAELFAPETREAYVI
jgi:4,5-dihydroxyphthalate decarboxylase